MKDTIKIYGNCFFEPPNKTKKHFYQSSWKKVAFVEFKCEIDDYYAWFIKKRYSVELNKNLRNPHVTFVNESLRDFGLGYKSNDEISEIWENVKKKFDQEEVEIELDLNPRTSGEYWWLNVVGESKEFLDSIRKELGLGKIYFGYHMSIGYIPDKMEEIIIKNGKEKKVPISDNIVRMEHSKYIQNLLKNGFIK